MTVEGNYTCDICGESFERNVDIATHVQSHQSSIDPDHILAELTRVADEKGRAPTQPEFNEEADCTHGAVQSHFGSWKDGLKAAGLEPLSHTYLEQELIDELQRVANVFGHSPSVAEMERKEPSHPTRYPSGSARGTKVFEQRDWPPRKPPKRRPKR